MRDGTNSVVQNSRILLKKFGIDYRDADPGVVIEPIRGELRPCIPTNLDVGCRFCCKMRVDCDQLALRDRKFADSPLEGAGFDPVKWLFLVCSQFFALLAFRESRSSSRRLRSGSRSAIAAKTQDQAAK